jgi:PAS domain S-box-containing protein
LAVEAIALAIVKGFANQSIALSCYTRTVVTLRDLSGTAKATAGRDEYVWPSVRICELETELLLARQQSVWPPEPTIRTAPTGTYSGVIAEVSGPGVEDYVFEQATPATEAFFGRKLHGVRASELGVPPPQIAARLAMMRACDATGIPRAQELCFPDGTGQDRWHFATYVPLPRTAQGRPRGAFTFIDITSRRNAAAELEQRVAERTAALAKSEAQNRAYFEASEDCLSTVAVTQDGRFLHEGYNPHGERRTGYANAVVQGRPMAAFMPPDMARTMQARCAEVVRQGTRRFIGPEAFPAGSGMFDTVMVPVRDPTGRTVRILAAAREISDQVRLEEQLRQSQKMQVIGQITGGVAHDFNNLLTGIIGALELLRRDVETPRGRRLMNVALRSAERGAQLTTQLLAFSRRQQLQPQPTDVNRLIEGMVDMLRSSLSTSVTVVTQLDAGLWPALADATQTQLAVLNVALNARDAMPGGGAIVIETANVRCGPPGCAEDPPAGAHIVVRIRDNGTGMPPEVLARVFEPFFTTKVVGRGSGLGLSQVLGVAKQLGGGVRVESTLGEGTLVQLFLPSAAGLAHVTGTVSAAHAPQTEAVPLAGANILLVDDDTEAREVAATVLEDLGGRVLQACSGRHALDLLASDVDIHAALIDYAMPGMDGLETARRVLALYPGLPVALATCFANKPAQAGPELPLLQKPFLAGNIASVAIALVRGRPPLPASVATD